MHIKGDYMGSVKTDGDVLITFRIPDISLDKLEVEKEYTLDIDKYSDKRSLNANRYFWKLVTLLGQKLGYDKDSMYRVQLSRYGVFQDVSILREALPLFEREFRYVEIFDDGYEVGQYITARCYFGSSKYDKKEMAALLEGTIQDCKDLGIETWSKEEIDHLISMWEGEK